jgi:hypothetical protein
VLAGASGGRAQGNDPEGRRAQWPFS